MANTASLLKGKNYAKGVRPPNLAPVDVSQYQRVPRVREQEHAQNYNGAANSHYQKQIVNIRRNHNFARAPEASAHMQYTIMQQKKALVDMYGKRIMRIHAYNIKRLPGLREVIMQIISDYFHTEHVSEKNIAVLEKRIMDASVAYEKHQFQHRKSDDASPSTITPTKILLDSIRIPGEDVGGRQNKKNPQMAKTVYGSFFPDQQQQQQYQAVAETPITNGAPQRAQRAFYAHAHSNSVNYTEKDTTIESLRKRSHSPALSALLEAAAANNMNARGGDANGISATDVQRLVVATSHGARKLKTLYGMWPSSTGKHRQISLNTSMQDEVQQATQRNFAFRPSSRAFDNVPHSVSPAPHRSHTPVTNGNGGVFHNAADNDQDDRPVVYGGVTAVWEDAPAHADGRTRGPAPLQSRPGTRQKHARHSPIDDLGKNFATAGNAIEGLTMQNFSVIVHGSGAQRRDEDASPLRLTQRSALRAQNRRKQVNFNLNNMQYH